MSAIEEIQARSIQTRLVTGVYLLGGFALAAVIAGLVIGGGAAPAQFGDPGAVVRWGTPIAKMVMNLSIAVTVGSLILGAFAVSRGEEQRKMLNIAAVGSALWLISGILYFLMTYLSASGLGIAFTSEFSEGLWLFATQIELGSALAVNLVFAAVLSLLTLLFIGTRSLGIMAAIGALSLFPLAETGHASSDANHALAVNSMLLHLVGISIWVGGLFSLYLIWTSNSKRNLELLLRYSSMALAAFALVGISGVANSATRLYQPSDILTPYGQLILIKVALLVVLGAFGAKYRLRDIKLMKQGNSFRFWRIALPELAIMGIVMGFSTALARTPTPIDEIPFTPPTPAEILTGDKLPPELTPSVWITLWDIDILWLVIALAGIFFYLAGVRRLKQRGDAWNLGRTASWIAGMLVLIYVTNGAPNAYHEFLFSVHMVGHMMLSMLVPVLLVPGAPVTLLSRAVKARKDDSWGPREWVMWAVHTPFAKFVSHPIVAAINFAVSLVLFYYTTLFRWANEDHVGHQWMTVHFLLAGYLFVQAVVGVDPTPHTVPYPLKLVLLIGTMAFHAFFGVALMSDNSLLLADWYGAMGREWGAAPLRDQADGGAIAWGIGEFPTLILTILVVYQWSKSDDRERKRKDRASDKTGNQDLEDYNQMFKKLNEYDGSR
ncbi:MAG TPA: cytochrome c oxidase assembly protein [Microbacteriaceae bacterium]